jgi:hypothetical protein
MARSNTVLRRFIDANGDSMDVFRCEACNTEFHRPTMRGVKPLFCPEHATMQAPRKPRENGTEEKREETTEKRAHHKAWPLLISALKAHTGDIPVQPYLYGEAGTGKTFTSGLAAKELGLEFRTESCSIGGTEVDFFGFIDANGNYHRTAFRDVWENGGVFLADELDKASPYVLSKLNAAFAAKAGTAVEFPDGPVKRHENCIIIGAGNTDMRGGTERFHTSQPVDAATMTRFVFIEWDYDEEFEFTLVSEKHHSWVRRVHAYRAAVRETNNHGANINVSPRAILMGARLRDAGMPAATIEEMVVWQGVNADTKTTVKRAARV